MTSRPTRRDVLRVAALAAGGLVIELSLPGCHSAIDSRTAARADRTGDFCPNCWVTITSTDRIVFWLDRAEMGQGTMTSQTTLLAEELEVDPHKVELEFAPANRAYDNPDPELGFQITGGSTTVKTSWEPLRAAGAIARDMLRSAAAASWGVPIEQCVAEGGAVAHAASGRRARYGELARAAAHQPVPEPRLKTRDQFKWIGKPMVRVDARRKVTGSGVYGLDVKLPGLLSAVVVRPPSLGATVRHFDAARARSESGVIDVFEMPSGVAVVATSTWRAMAAAKLVRVEWSDGELAKVSTAELERAYRARTRKPAKVVRSEGNLDEGFARGAHVIDATYEAPYLAHAPMEPQNATASVTRGRCEVWCPTQSAALAQALAMRITGLPRDRITIHTTLIGGGFGRRLAQDYVGEAVWVSKRLGKPVKVVWSREDDMRHDFYRPMTAHWLRGAVDAKGNVVAWFHRIVGQSIAAQVAPEWAASVAPTSMPESLKGTLGKIAGSLLGKNVVPDPASIQGAGELTYAIANQRIEYAAVEPGIPVGFWRSVGHSQNAFVVESFIDELAYAARVDPYRFRRTLLRNDPRLLRTLDLAASQAGWEQPAPPGRFRGIASWHSFGTYCTHVAEISVTGKTLRVHRVVAAVDCGTRVNPDLVLCQVESAIVFGLSAALKQKINLDGGRVREGNFNTFPVLRMHETPVIDVHVVPSDEPPSGIGEPGVPPVAPAVANALFAATGKRIRRLPLEAAFAEAT
jgi:CO/xanthine dehydrogenase Mo-binding subunit